MYTYIVLRNKKLRKEKKGKEKKEKKRKKRRKTGKPYVGIRSTVFFHCIGIGQHVFLSLFFPVFKGTGSTIFFLFFLLFFSQTLFFCFSLFLRGIGLLFFFCFFRYFFYLDGRRKHFVFFK